LPLRHLDDVSQRVVGVQFATFGALLSLDCDRASGA
jgi:hypothetical protein